MHGAKNAGRGRTERYSKAMRARIAERHEIEANLRLALTRDEFRLVYQPIIDLQTGQIVAVKRLGLQVALDDFGTGYSALAYLRRFPIDILKVDKSFVSWVRRDASDDGLTRAILAMGQSLSMQTVAEGIETTAQLDWLRALGCTHGQGYLFSRPVPRDDLVEILASWDPWKFAAPKSDVLALGSV